MTDPPINKWSPSLLLAYELAISDACMMGHSKHDGKWSNFTSLAAVENPRTAI